MWYKPCEGDGFHLTLRFHLAIIFWCKLAVTLSSLQVDSILLDIVNVEPLRHVGMHLRNPSWNGAVSWSTMRSHEYLHSLSYSGVSL